MWGGGYVCITHLWALGNFLNRFLLSFLNQCFDWLQRELACIKASEFSSRFKHLGCDVPGKPEELRYLPCSHCTGADSLAPSCSLENPSYSLSEINLPTLLSQLPKGTETRLKIYLVQLETVYLGSIFFFPLQLQRILLYPCINNKGSALSSPAQAWLSRYRLCIAHVTSIQREAVWRIPQSQPPTRGTILLGEVTRCTVRTRRATGTARSLHFQRLVGCTCLT